jgi:AcrR family transcriptional regulator
MSSSAVYRYFRSKDELIDAAADEALGLIRDLFDRQLQQRPVPTPAEVITAMFDEIGSRASNPDYDLTRIAIQSWGEALRRPALEERTRSFYLSVHAKLAELSSRWRDEGLVPADTDDAQLATVVMSLMPGILVGRNLVADVSAAHLIGGLASLGVALAKG